MVKFSRELEAQLIPEWKEAFVNYKFLKKHIKKIKIALLHHPSSTDPLPDDASSHAVDVGYGFSLLDPVRSLASRLRHRRHTSHQLDEENMYEMELIQPGDQEVKVFLEKADMELQKVNNFYTTKEAEFCERAEALIKQLQILSDVKEVLDNFCQRQQRRRILPPDSVASPGSLGTLLSRVNSQSSDLSVQSESTEEADQMQSDSSLMAEEVIAVLEKNGVKIIGAARGKAKKGTKPKMASMRIDIPPSTPTRTIAAVTSVVSSVWEDLINGSRKDGTTGGSYINNKKIQCAEKMIRGAFVELYRGLGLIKKFSSLNMQAFTKIMKKFGKVSRQQSTAETFLRKVKSSQFVSSDKVIKLGDEVEGIFTQHFAGNDRKKAMKFLRPRQPKDSHLVTFFVGLFTGSFVTLFGVYAVLAHLCGIFSSNPDKSGYVESFYPVFSIYALVSLHVFMYGCNLFMWRNTRINQNFIFEFATNTALKPRDAFLICASLMTTVVGAMVIHLVLNSSSVGTKHADTLPGLLSLLLIGLFICPFNVFYRSTRYCLLRVIRDIILAPLYKVVMVDFFMADQLCSQIPLMRHIEFTACYFMAMIFKTHSYDTCSHSPQYKMIAYTISFLPYYWRFMQCLRRYFEEGRDRNHLTNAGKYGSALVVAFFRVMYTEHPNQTWLAFVIIFSIFATCYQLYWDFVKDWGFFDLESKNFLLRDDLVLKHKFIYYISMGVNLGLRLAWVFSVMHLNVGPFEHRLIDFVLASLEVIRRGHWNFYRLENEHLNNVGKFRALKEVPLPFREMDSN
ncbi:Phosphate transporter PHO1-1 [Rhynchospora pubera]|uniref:Phosphate transporter PHO1-1 n=1 Tax=Rhynchospora pubera TaxID=906938 RepID=A0AAV8GC95_9POAL|nr:Phosphate transporter PHO1-1 [Rhynchospora pubera]